MKIQREEQKAQEPKARVGKTQAKVPTHEGSMLGMPMVAKATTTNMPADKEAQ